MLRETAWSSVSKRLKKRREKKRRKEKERERIAPVIVVARSIYRFSIRGYDCCPIQPSSWKKPEVGIKPLPILSFSRRDIKGCSYFCTIIAFIICIIAIISTAFLSRLIYSQLENTKLRQYIDKNIFKTNLVFIYNNYIYYK